MGLNRFAKRRDANEKPLLAAAKQLGAKLWPLDTPCDHLMLWRTRWYPVEIKVKTGRLTENQEEFHEEADAAGGEILLWRTIEDVVRDLNRLPQKVDQR